MRLLFLRVEEVRINRARARAFCSSHARAEREDEKPVGGEEACRLPRFAAPRRCALPRREARAGAQQSSRAAAAEHAGSSSRTAEHAAIP